MSAKETFEMSCRQLLLQFYSSEISTHGRVFIGFAALMFTVLNVRLGLFDNGELKICQMVIVYGVISLVAWAIFYELFRLLGYGILANATIHAPSIQKHEQGKSSVHPFLLDVMSHIFASGYSRYIMGFIPIEYFFNLGKPHRQLYGVLICVGLAVATATLVYLLLEV